jgi:hypothetical protein
MSTPELKRRGYNSNNSRLKVANDLRFPLFGRGDNRMPLREKLYRFHDCKNGQLLRTFREWAHYYVKLHCIELKHSGYTAP